MADAFDVLCASIRFLFLYGLGTSAPAADHRTPADYEHTVCHVPVGTEPYLDLLGADVWLPP